MADETQRDEDSAASEETRAAVEAKDEARAPETGGGLTGRLSRLNLWLVTLLLTGGVCTGSGWLLTIDGEPPSLKALEFRVAPEASVYKTLIEDTPPVALNPKGTVVDEWESPDLESKRRVSPSFLKTMIAPNRAAVRELIALSDKSWRSPPKHINHLQEMPHLLPIKSAAQVLRYEAWCHARAGRVDAAWQAARDARRLGDRLERDARSIIGWLVAVAVRNIARELVIDLMVLLPLDQQRATEESRALGALTVDRHGLEEALKGEALCLTKAIDGVADGSLDKDLVADISGAAWTLRSPVRHLAFKRNRTKEAALAWHRKVSEQLGRRISQTVPVSTGPPRELTKLEMLSDSNFGGQQMLELMLPADQALLKKRAADLAAHRMTALALRLAAVEQATGRLPAKLSELDLSDLPKDILEDPFAPGMVTWSPKLRSLDCRGDASVEVPQLEGAKSTKSAKPAPGGE